MVVDVQIWGSITLINQPIEFAPTSLKPVESGHRELRAEAFTLTDENLSFVVP